MIQLNEIRGTSIDAVRIKIDQMEHYYGEGIDEGSMQKHICYLLAFCDLSSIELKILLILLNSKEAFWNIALINL